MVQHVLTARVQMHRSMCLPWLFLALPVRTREWLIEAGDRSHTQVLTKGMKSAVHNALRSHQFV